MSNLKNTEIANQFKNELATGKAVIFAITASAKRAGAFDYHIAQERKRSIANDDIKAIAVLRSLAFKNAIYRTWLSSISAEQHDENIKNGFVKQDANGDFEPTVLEGMHVVIRETTNPLEVAYKTEDGGAAISASRFKRLNNAVLLSDGKPIFRSTTLSVTANDELIASNGTAAYKDEAGFKEYVAEFVLDNSEELAAALDKIAAAKVAV